MSTPDFDPTEHPHRRRNILTGDWVLVSPHRTKRPWQGQVERLPADTRPAYEPTCYLCPGNERAGGLRNPAYEGTYVFDNDFAALLPNSPNQVVSQDKLFQAEAESGICRVICFSPRHDLTLPEMEITAIERVVNVWAEQIAELGSRPDIGYVQLFENKGAAMGSSNPHPHGQLWASHRVPQEPAKEDHMQRTYYAEQQRPLLLDYLAAELEQQDRIVIEQAHWVALVPYWAGLALRSAAVAAASCHRAACPHRRGADRFGPDPQAVAHPLRQSVRDQLPLFDGLAWAADRERRLSPLAIACPFLSTLVAFGDCKKIYGRL
jgi:UDPglucose--hexose-1-phosphate uridylyltransferase